MLARSFTVYRLGPFIWIADQAPLEDGMGKPILPCPFCNELPEGPNVFDVVYHKSHGKCPLGNSSYDIDDWNYRRSNGVANNRVAPTIQGQIGGNNG